MAMELTHKPWESDWLAKPAYALTLGGDLPTEPELSARLDTLPRPCFVATRIEAQDAERNRLVQQAGFGLVEAYLILQRSMDQLPEPSARPGIRGADSTDAAALGPLAHTAFSQSRFHRDPQIPREQADHSRMLWVLNALEDPAKEVIVAEADGTCAGFLIARPADDSTHVLDLMAVAEAFRGRGLGRMLTMHFFYLASCAGAQRVVVGTQDVNIASLNLYLGCGFRHSRVQYSYHLHR